VTKDQAAPEWTKRIRLFGDVRVRSQSSLYAKTNSDQIFDFTRMTAAGQPIDLARLASYQFLNTRKDRTDARYRARLGIEAQVVKGVTATIVLGTGDDNSPISENASLGGGFAKRAIFVDTAEIKVKPTDWATLHFGRFENPFNTTPLLYDEDLRFDGVSAALKWAGLFGKDLGITVTGGAFPLDYGDGNFPNVAVNKLSDPSKWLYAGELKLSAPITDALSVDASAAYHSFRNVQGRLSEPCNLDLGNFCSTDGVPAAVPAQGQHALHDPQPRDQQHGCLSAAVRPEVRLRHPRSKPCGEGPGFGERQRAARGRIRQEPRLSNVPTSARACSTPRRLSSCSPTTTTAPTGTRRATSAPRPTRPALSAAIPAGWSMPRSVIRAWSRRAWTPLPNTATSKAMRCSMPILTAISISVAPMPRAT